MTADPSAPQTPPPAVVIPNTGEHGLEMQARPFVSYPDYDPVRFSFRQQIAQALTAAGIEFAVPQRDVSLSPAAPGTPPASESILPIDQRS